MIFAIESQIEKNPMIELNVDGPNGEFYEYQIKDENGVVLLRKERNQLLNGNVEAALTIIMDAIAVSPETQASSIGFANVTDTDMDVSWTRGDGSGVLILAHEGAAVDTNPSNYTEYTADATFGDGSEIGTGNFVVYIGPGDTETVTGLTSETTYHFQAFEFNGTGAGASFITETATDNPNSQLTLPSVPATQASAITFDNVAATSVDVDFTDGSGLSRILVAREGGAVNASPSNLTTYVGDENFGDGDEIGTGNFVVGVGSGPFSITGLTTATTYHFRVFEFNGPAGSEIYKTSTATGNPASQATA